MIYGDINMKIFAERFQELRLQANLSQVAISRHLGLKDSRSIRQYERNEAEPSLKNLILISNLFDASIEYMLGMTDEKNSTAKCLTQDQQDLLSTFDSLSKERQTDAMKLLRALQ